MRKLDQFKGKIDFSQDPKQTIKVLQKLQDYLETYEEPDAKRIVEEFKSLAKAKTGTHQEKLLSKQFITSYNKRTEVLQSISHTLKRIQEDLVDEQDTSIKKKSQGNFSKNGFGENAKKVRISVAENLKKASQKGVDLFETILGKIGMLRSMLPVLVSGLTTTLVGVAFAAVGTLRKLVTRSVGGVFKLLGKSTKWMGGKILQGVGLVSKQIWKGAKFLSGLFGRAGTLVVGLVSKGLQSIGNLLRNLWKSIKTITRAGKKSGGSLHDKVAKNPAESVDGKRSKFNKTGRPVSDKGWFQKNKEAISNIKRKVIPALEKKGMKGVAKAVTKSVAKLASRAIPFLGWGLLAYDAFSAAKKSNSLTQFGVNLLDEVSGGLISMSVGDMGNKNLGEYIEGVISNDSSKPGEQGGIGAASNAPGNSKYLKSSAGPDTIDKASSSKYSLENATASIPSNSTSVENNVSNHSQFVSKYSRSKNFDFYYNKLISNQITYDQAVNAIENNISPSTLQNVEILDSKQEIYQQIKDQAVEESAIVSRVMAERVLHSAAELSYASMNQASNLINNQVVINQSIGQSVPALVIQG